MLIKFNSCKLRDTRRKSKLSQMLLAEICDTSDRYLRDLERGAKDNPSAALVWILSRALGVTIDDLMEEKSDKEQKE